MLVVILLPFWYRRRASRRPGVLYRAVITFAVFGFLACTLWGGWPGHHGEHGEQLISLGQYISQQPTMFAMMALSLVVFYVLIAHERRAIRRILDADDGQNEAGLDTPSSAGTKEPQP